MLQISWLYNGRMGHLWKCDLGMLALPNLFRFSLTYSHFGFAESFSRTLATPNLLPLGKTQIHLDHRSYFAASQQMKCKLFFVLMLQNLVFHSLIRNFVTQIIIIRYYNDSFL